MSLTKDQVLFSALMRWLVAISSSKPFLTPAGTSHTSSAHTYIQASTYTHKKFKRNVKKEREIRGLSITLYVCVLWPSVYYTKWQKAFP